MSRRTQPLIRRAAAMFVAGRDSGTIIKTLGIRYHTLLRWEQTPLYQQEIERHNRQLEQRVSSRLLRLLDDCMDDTSEALATDRETLSIDPKNINIVINILKAIGKDRVFSTPPDKNPPKEAHKGAQKAQKMPITPPNNPAEAPV